MSENDYLTVMRDAAMAASIAIMSIYRQDFTVKTKSDQSPVTLADHEAEAIILSYLKRAFPRLTVIAEEKMADGWIPEQLSETFFLVDPLDGTREFIARNGEFTVNIALIDKNRPRYGVIAVPDRCEIYWGGPEGAMMACFDERGVLSDTRGIACRIPQQPPVVVSSRSHCSEITRNWMNALGDADCRQIGSALKYCLLAKGEADLYPRFQPAMEWDTAAGEAILMAAGGSVVDSDGKILLYGQTNRPDQADFGQSFIIARGKPLK